MTVAARPLSAAEARLWELEAGGDASGVHRFALAYRLTGPLDVERLVAALRAVVARHVGLRVRVVTRDGTAALEDQPDLEVRLERRPETGEAVDAALLELARAPFDLAEGPAWRGALFTQAADDHTLLLRFHHIAADRWSVAVLMGDLGRAYTALAEGRTPFEGEAAPDPAEQLARAAGAAATPEERSAQLEFWRAHLAGPPPAVRLPGAHADAHFDYRGERLDRVVDEATRAAARTAGQAQAVTLFPVLLAAFAAALHARTGQEDLLFCTPVLGRHRAATRNLVGYFNNIVPLRLNLAGDPTLGELVARARDAARDALSHAEVPLQDIAGLPELAGLRLTRALFAVQNVPGLAPKLPGVTCTYRDVPNGTANFDLSCFFEEKDGALHLFVDHKSASLDDAAARALTDGMLEAVRQLAEAPGTRLSALAVAGPAATDAAEAPAPRSARAAATDPGSVLEVRLLELWRRIFPDAALDADTDFFEVGGDSMDAARLFAAIRKEFGYELPLATLFEAPTVRQLVERLGREDWVAPWMSVVPVQPRGSRPALFCIHGGGGNVLAYRQLADALGPDQPVYCLQARGLKVGDRPLSSVEEMAEHYLEAMRRSHPTGPYLLGGHSLGAVVALEMAQRLVAAGESVPLVALLDHPGPGIRLSRVDWFRYHIMNLSMLSGPDRLEYIRNHVRWKFKAWEARRHLAGQQAAHGPGTNGSGANGHAPRAAAGAEAVGPISLLEASLLAIQNYRIRPYPGHLTLFRARGGAPKILADRWGGWNEVAPGRVTVIEVPGTHMTMMKMPHVREVGLRLGECLRGMKRPA